MDGLRINIIGASGVGKTTLAAEVSKHFRIPHFDSDHYYHLPTDPPFQKQRSPLERMSMVAKDLGEFTSWVLSGAVANWYPEPKLDYTLIVLLYLMPEIRLEQLRRREHQLYGSRIQSGGDMASDHKFFMNWSAGYDSGLSEGTNTLGHHEAILKRVSCPIIRIDTPMTTEERLRIIARFVSL